MQITHLQRTKTQPTTLSIVGTALMLAAFLTALLSPGFARSATWQHANEFDFAAPTEIISQATATDGSLWRLLSHNNDQTESNRGKNLENYLERIDLTTGHTVRKIVRGTNLKAVSGGQVWLIGATHVLFSPEMIPITVRNNMFEGQVLTETPQSAIWSKYGNRISHVLDPSITIETPGSVQYHGELVVSARHESGKVKVYRLNPQRRAFEGVGYIPEACGISSFTNWYRLISGSRLVYQKCILSFPELTPLAVFDSWPSVVDDGVQSKLFLHQGSTLVHLSHDGLFLWQGSVNGAIHVNSTSFVEYAGPNVNIRNLSDGLVRLVIPQAGGALFSGLTERHWIRSNRTESKIWDINAGQAVSSISAPILPVLPQEARIITSDNSVLVSRTAFTWDGSCFAQLDKVNSESGQLLWRSKRQATVAIGSGQNSKHVSSYLSEREGRIAWGTQCYRFGNWRDELLSLDSDGTVNWSESDTYASTAPLAGPKFYGTMANAGRMVITRYLADRYVSSVVDARSGQIHWQADGGLSRLVGSDILEVAGDQLILRAITDGRELWRISRPPRMNIGSIYGVRSDSLWMYDYQTAQTESLVTLFRLDLTDGSLWSRAVALNTGIFPSVYFMPLDELTESPEAMVFRVNGRGDRYLSVHHNGETAFIDSQRVFRSSNRGIDSLEVQGPVTARSRFSGQVNKHFQDLGLWQPAPYDNFKLHRVLLGRSSPRLESQRFALVYHQRGAMQGVLLRSGSAIADESNKVDLRLSAQRLPSAAHEVNYRVRAENAGLRHAGNARLVAPDAVASVTCVSPASVCESLHDSGTVEILLNLAPMSSVEVDIRFADLDRIKADLLLSSDWFQIEENIDDNTLVLGEKIFSNGGFE